MKSLLFQSKAWQNLQNDLGETCFYQKSGDLHFLAIKKSTPLGNYLHLPYGPIASTKAEFAKLLKDITALARQEDAFFIRIEPQNKDLSKYLPKSAKKTKDENPKDTWQLDLTQPAAKIIENFSHGIRNAYNTFEKRGLTVTATKDLEELKHLTRLQAQLFQQKNLKAHSEDYFRAELSQPFTTLYLATYHDRGQKSDHQPKNGEVIAASLFFDYGDTRYYMQSAADTSYKNLPSTVAILTTAIFDAKKKGIKHFDFWGIAPDDANKNHPWAGFTKFKKSFGGAAVHYAGTYDLVQKPMRYRLYQFTRKLHLLLRHL